MVKGGLIHKWFLKLFYVYITFGKMLLVVQLASMQPGVVHTFPINNYH